MWIKLKICEVSPKKSKSSATHGTNSLERGKMEESAPMAYHRAGLSALLGSMETGQTSFQDPNLQTAYT